MNDKEKGKLIYETSKQTTLQIRKKKINAEQTLEIIIQWRKWKFVVWYYDELGILWNW